MKCPICDQDLKLKMEVGSLSSTEVTERVRECRKGHFKEDYFQEYFHVTVGNQVFMFHESQLEKFEPSIREEANKIKEFNRKCKVALSVATAILLPGGLILVPLYHWFKKRKSPKA